VDNNDILRRIRYIFDYSDSKMQKVFALVGREIKREQIINWLKREDETDFSECNDFELATFLNGLIVEKRGKKEGVQIEAEKHLNNNMVFRKLKIALDLKAEEILEILLQVNFRLSKHELSAFFRKKGHKHHRQCLDQILRNFLMGVQLKYRGKAE